MIKTLKTAALLAGISSLALLSGCGGGDDTTVAPPTGTASSPAFVFDPTPADSPLYLRVDRTGGPAVATALLSRDPAVTIPGVAPGNAANNFADQRDQLNRGDPVNDARDFAATYVGGPQPNSLKNIHFRIADELRSLGLTPCSTTPGAPNAAAVNVDTCVAQAAPVILPDTITYDFSQPAGFPNGRAYDDPVADRLLAAALLRISGPGAPHNLNTLVGVIDTWNGPVGQGCVAPCQNTGDESNVVSPTTFPFLRPAYPP